MIAKLRTHDLARLTRLKGEGHLFESRHHAAAGKEAQIPAVLLRSIIRQLCGQSCEVFSLLRPFQGVIRLSFELGLIGRTHFWWHSEENVAGADLLLFDILVFVLVIEGLDIARADIHLVKDFLLD